MRFIDKDELRPNEVRIKLKTNLTLQIHTEDYEYVEAMRGHFERMVPGFQYMPQYRSGFWNGRVCMIDKFGRTFPYGMLFDYIRVHKKEFPRNPLRIDENVKELFISNEDIKLYYDLKYVPRPYQDDCIKAAFKYTKGIIRSATASGKSLVITYVIYNLLKNNMIDNCIIIVPSTSLIKQFHDDMLDYGIIDDMIGEVWAKKKEWDKTIVISTWQSLSRNKPKMKLFDAVIVDECLDGNTKIKTVDGEKRISEIKIDDKVISYNIKKDIFEEDIVDNVYENMYISDDENMYEIEMEDGSIIKITGNHKVLTKRGYIRVDCLCEKDMKIKSIRKIEKPNKVYNLHIRNNNNYIANGIVVSNCHGTKAKQLKDTLSRCDANYRLGFTGTMPPDDLDSWNVKAYLGPVIRDYSAGELASDGWISKCTINFLNVEYNQEEWEGTYTEVKQQIFENPYRIDLIKKLTCSLDHNVLLLVGKVESEGEFLKEKLEDCGKEVVFLSGRDGVNVREKWRKACMKRDDIALIATYGIFQQGINIPNLKYIVLAAPFKSKIRVLQSIGRGLRKHADKENGAIIYDIHDHTRYLADYGNIRLRYYDSEKFEVNELLFREGEEIVIS